MADDASYQQLILTNLQPMDMKKVHLVKAVRTWFQTVRAVNSNYAWKDSAKSMG